MAKKPKRGRSGRKYARTANNWKAARDEAFQRAGDTCEITGDDLVVVKHGEDCTDGQCDAFDEGYCVKQWRRAVDHLIPERWVRRFCKGCNPHVRENLYCVSSSLHAKKTAIEYLLFRGDKIGYLRELNRLGWSVEYYQAAVGAILDSEQLPAVAANGKGGKDRGKGEGS